MTEPRVSVGMPVYNGGAYLGAALSSLCAQSRGDFELIISDNASTDESAAIAEGFATRDSRIRVVRQPENLGAIGNFHVVLKEARAPFFMWAASDDIWSPDWIERLLPVAETRGCIAFGRVQTMDAGGNPVRHAVNGRDFSFTGPPGWRRIRYFLQPAFLGKANPIYGVFPRDLLLTEALSPFLRGGHGADMLALYRLLRDVELVSIAGPTIFKRQHRGSAAMARGKQPMFRRTQLPDYLALSSPLECAALIAAFPLASALIPLRRIAMHLTPPT